MNKPNKYADDDICMLALDPPPQFVSPPPVQLQALMSACREGNMAAAVAYVLACREGEIEHEAAFVIAC